MLGHKVNDILSTLKKIENSNSFQPKLILANTIKGKGVSFMENKMEWHYLNIDDELLAKSYDEVENYILKVVSESNIKNLRGQFL